MDYGHTNNHDVENAPFFSSGVGGESVPHSQDDLNTSLYADVHDYHGMGNAANRAIFSSENEPAEDIADTLVVESRPAMKNDLGVIIDTEPTISSRTTMQSVPTIKGNPQDVVETIVDNFKRSNLPLEVVYNEMLKAREEYTATHGGKN